MLEKVLIRPCVIRSYRSSLLSDHVDAFAAQLIERGHPIPEVRRKLNVVPHLSRWMKKRGIVLAGLGEPQIQQFLAYRQRRGCFGILQSQRVALSLLVEEFRAKGIIPDAPAPESSVPKIDALVHIFTNYLKDQRGLQPGTYEYYAKYARIFIVHCFGVSSVSFSNLTGKRIQDFILLQSRSQGAKSCQKITTALKSFLKFLFLYGKTESDLAIFVPTVSNRRNTHIPCFLSPVEVQKVLNSCNLKSSMGRRDYAILLLLARFGLRSGEVRNLTLEDISWDSGEITIRGKSRRENRFPLPQDVGGAIVQYLKTDRPSCSSRNLFICTRAPYRGLSNASSLGIIVTRALKRSGLNPPQKGAHLLRHSAATQILRGGASLNDVGEILRHRQINTSAIYAKVDLPRLKILS